MTFCSSVPSSMLDPFFKQAKPNEQRFGELFQNRYGVIKANNINETQGGSISDYNFGHKKVTLLQC